MPANPGQPIRVVVADDHPMYRQSLARVVESNPKLELVGAFDDGHGALEALRALHPEVAVIDLRMPGLDGTQLVEAVAAERLDTRVLLLSGHLQDASVYRALELGAAGVLSKVESGTAVTDAILAVARGETVIAREAQEAVARDIRRRAVPDTPPLTPRELQVLRLVATGGSVPSIAGELVAPATVKTHLEHLYRKLGVSERAAAVAEAMRRGVLE